MVIRSTRAEELTIEQERERNEQLSRSIIHPGAQPSGDHSERFEHVPTERTEEVTEP